MPDGANEATSLLVFFPKEAREESWPLVRVGYEWYWGNTRAGLIRQVVLGNGHVLLPGHLHAYKTRIFETYRTYMRSSACGLVGCPRAAR